MFSKFNSFSYSLKFNGEVVSLWDKYRLLVWVDEILKGNFINHTFINHTRNFQ